MKKLSAMLILFQSTSSFATTVTTRVEVQPTTQKIVLTGTGQNTNSLIGYSDDLIMTATRSRITTVIIPTVSYSCESAETNADGSKGDWNNFYSVPKAEKAAALAASIKGLGKKTAPYLVDAFSAGKPRSWAAFAQIVKATAKSLQAQGIDASFVNDVLYTYKEENIRKLGYLSATNGTECVATVTEQKVESAEKLSDLNALVKAKVAKIVLLPGESEEMTITFDGTRVAVQADQSFNTVAQRISYSDYGRRYDVSSTVEVVGTGRRQVTPENIVESNMSSFSTSGQISLSTQSARALMANPIFAARCKASVNASVVGETKNWFADWNPSTRTVASKVIELDLASGQTSSSFGAISLSAKEGAYVTYTMSFAAGCPFYNTNPSLQSTIGR